MSFMPPVHTDPLLTIADQAVFAEFCRRAQIQMPLEHEGVLMAKLCAALSRIPYENLTKIIKADDVINPGSAKRLPDEVIRDYLHYGAGGTCFSLTAACIAIFNACGIEAHPILADRHYGVDTHCALVFPQESGLMLLDPGYLIHEPIRLPTAAPVTLTHGFNTLELAPRNAGQIVELFTVVNNSRKSRLTYKVTLLDGAEFGRAWERSFAWEMMTYPVLTRKCHGVHQYLQGNNLRIRDEARTTKLALTPEQEYDFISQTLGIHPTIIKQAFAIVSVKN